MQTILAKLYLIVFVIACGAACSAPQHVLPTRLLPAQLAAVSTPTLAATAPSFEAASFEADGSPSLADHQSIGDPYIPELGSNKYDVQRYSLQLALNPVESYVSGTAELELISLEDGLTHISLDFVGFDIVRVDVLGTPAAFTRDAKKLLVALPQPMTTGMVITLTVVYQGAPIYENSPFVGYADHLGLSFVNKKSIYVLSEPDGARYWFPSNDHPRDKALFRFELTVPAGLTAVANGRLVELRQPSPVPVPGGGPGRTFVWEHNYPMATYLAVVAVDEFERLETVSPSGITLRHYVTKGHLEELESAVSDLGETIDWMSELLGPYPFEEFGYVATDLPPTAMETQTMVLISNDLIGRRTAVHELVHMWFGDWVSLNSWSEMWRKEGLATYITLLWETRDVPETIDARIAEVLAAVAENNPQYPIGNPPPELLLGYNTYFKGAAFIHTLRRTMGDESFFGGLRAYLQRYGGGAATDAQFREVMEAAAGFSLESYFTVWLN